VASVAGPLAAPVAEFVGLVAAERDPERGAGLRGRGGYRERAGSGVGGLHHHARAGQVLRHAVQVRLVGAGLLGQAAAALADRRGIGCGGGTKGPERD
jgi:hypothetical protein